MKKFTLSVVICLNCLLLIGQKNIKNGENNNAQLSIKFSPLGFIEPDQAISIAGELRILTHIGIQLEGSYIFNTIYLSNARTISHTQGFRIVPELRYYDNNFKRNIQRYVGLQFSYKQLRKDVEDWVYKPNYQQLETIQLKKNNIALAIIAGLQNHTNLIGYDFNIGVGVKYKSLDQLSKFAERDMIPSYLGETLTGFYPQLSTTFKLCVKIQ